MVSTNAVEKLPGKYMCPPIDVSGVSKVVYSSSQPGFFIWRGDGSCKSERTRRRRNADRPERWGYPVRLASGRYHRHAHAWAEPHKATDQSCKRGSLHRTTQALPHLHSSGDIEASIDLSEECPAKRS